MATGPLRTRKKPWIHRYQDILSNKHTGKPSVMPPQIDRSKDPKVPADSFITEFLPFHSNADEGEQYVNTYGGLRIGKLLQDLDSFAALVAYKHCGVSFRELDSPLDIVIVTAAVERVDLVKIISLDQDYELFGQVTHTGRSSLEVTLRVRETESPNHICMSAKFHMVARNLQGKAATINPLIPQTVEEKEWFALGEANKARRIKAAQEDLSVANPTIEESQIIHEMYQQSLNAENPNGVPLSSTKLESVLLTLPQQRNLHNRIFGGVLMLKSFELAYAAAVCING
jgi:acyl-coenzyme A thioesterase 9